MLAWVKVNGQIELDFGNYEFILFFNFFFNFNIILLGNKAL